MTWELQDGFLLRRWILKTQPSLSGMLEHGRRISFTGFVIYAGESKLAKCNSSQMPAADRRRRGEVGHREPARRGQKRERVKEIESLWGPIRGSSEGL